MSARFERLGLLARRTFGWWMVPILLFVLLAGLALLGDKAPLRFLVYSVL